MAPEVATKHDNISKCDVWSCGVILFILLSGTLPFKGNNDNEVIERVIKGQFNFDKPIWKNVSSRAKMLIREMLEVNVKQRITFIQCIESQWIKMSTKIDNTQRVDPPSADESLRYDAGLPARLQAPYAHTAFLASVFQLRVTHREALQNLLIH